MRTIMLVDDEELSRFAMRTLLMRNFSDVAVVAEAETGEEALALYERQRPDGIIMDIRIPGMDGLKTSRRILEQYPMASILICSAYDSFSLVSEALEIGVKGYLLKPVKREELLDRIRRLFDLSPSRVEVFADQQMLNLLLAPLQSETRGQIERAYGNVDQGILMPFYVPEPDRDRARRFSYALKKRTTPGTGCSSASSVSTMRPSPSSANLRRSGISACRKPPLKRSWARASMGRSIARPIDALAQRMRTYPLSDDDVPQIKPSAIAEIYTLEDSYSALMTVSEEPQRMERELARQRLENEETRNLLKSAELDMLRMQMNPHFLFNTLNSISALGEMENAPLVSEMVLQLSEMLRYSMSAASPTTPLSEAMSIVDDYVGILRTRFGDRLEYRRDIQEEALMLPVPRMMIQPLVENAVQHGFPRIQHGSRVEVEARLEDDLLVVQVRDNGAGMSEERLKSLIDETDEAQGIGLRNVITRMRLLYGPGHTEVESREGEGTCMTLRIPDTTLHSIEDEYEGRPMT